MILPRHSPPVLRVYSHLRPQPAATPGGFAVGRSFGKCQRPEWTSEGLRCQTGRVIHGTVYAVASHRTRGLDALQSAENRDPL